MGKKDKSSSKRMPDAWNYVGRIQSRVNKSVKLAEEAASNKNYSSASTHYKSAVEALEELENTFDSKDKRPPYVMGAYRVAGTLAAHKPGYLRKANKFQKKTESKEKGLLGKLGFSLFFFILSLFFLSPNLTGNVIGNLSNKGSSLIGIIFFILGAGFFLWKK